MALLAHRSPGKILIRSTNWIGDAIMTTPAVRTIRRNFPAAEIVLLCQPWVADIFVASPDVDRLILYEKKSRHGGLAGMWRLAAELRRERFDLAILLQNAFEAAWVARLAGIPLRAGYRRDGRRLLLSHGVGIDRAVRKRHQVHYYQEMLRKLGLEVGPDRLVLELPRVARRWARNFLLSRGTGPLVGFNPGAAYGPAKRWPAERFADLARHLCDDPGAEILVFGTDEDGEAANLIKEAAPQQVVDLTGRTSLVEAMALIEQCRAFVTNDSGLMHVAAALDTPLVALFGSTDEIATGPFSPRARVLKKPLACSPCLKTHCPDQHYACMRGIEAVEVAAAVRALLAAHDLARRTTP